MAMFQEAKMNNADLHIHSTMSDGLLSPEEIIDWGLKKGLRALAITDHDSISGIRPALKYSAGKDIEVIPGIEFSTEFENSEVHMLGYFMNLNDTNLNRLLKKLRDCRADRALTMVNKLKSIGYDITIDDVKAECRKAKSIGRPHVARALVRKGYCEDIHDAFNKLLVRGKPAFVERFKLSPFQALEVIKDSGGVASIAHPGLIANINVENLIKRLKGWGLSGIEVYHSKHTIEDNILYERIAKDLNLIPTGGSDCHGELVDNEPSIGSVVVPYENILMLKKAAGIK